jgi:basic membrane protein A and related proteins
MSRRPRRIVATVVALTALVTLTLAVSVTSSASTANASATPIKVGFIMVGSRKDYGYNQAVYDGSQGVAKMPGVTVVTADSVPENNSVVQTMQSMASDGVKLIFATSYGYFKYAQQFAADNPDVVVVHQGGFLDGKFPANFGTYWGEAFEPVSLGGMAAGSVTKSGKLGYVYAFPIPQTIQNIDAFQLGAQAVNPKAKTYLVNTSSWCDPLKQKTAASALLSQGVDVLTQHQDCQATVVQASKAKGAYSVGYHYNAQSLNPSGWLTGSAWAWAPLYEKIVATVQSGKFAGSTYNKNWVGSFQTKNNPLTLAPFGPAVKPAVRTKILSTLSSLKKPGASVFKGPIYCQDGTLLVKPGVVPTYAQINSFDCLVKGVVGNLPKS